MPAVKVEGSQFNQPADAAAITELRKALPPETPADYFEFLRSSDGCEVWFDEDDPAWFDSIGIYSAAEVMKYRKTFAELLPDLLVIGSDQGSQYFGYDMTASGAWPLVIYLPGCGQTPVADSMAELAERYFRPTGARTEPKPST